MRYRIVHFAPCPINGLLWPIAALLETGGRHIPGVETFGRASTAAAARMVADAVARDVFSLDVLPASVGPYVRLGDMRLMPSDVGDPVSWLESILPGKPEG